MLPFNLVLVCRKAAAVTAESVVDLMTLTAEPGVIAASAGGALSLVQRPMRGGY